MQKRTTWIIAFLTMITMLSGLFVYLQGNRQVPIHWGYDGVVDRYAPSYYLFLLPLLIPLLDMILNIARKIDPKHANYQKFASSFATIRIAVALLLFGCCIVTMIETYNPNSIDVEMVIILFVGMMICLFGNIMPRIRPNFCVGIRNPWTLTNETVWRNTHRISGWLWFLGGFLICLIALFQLNSISFIVILCILAIIPNVYSYFIYHHIACGKEQTHD